MNSKIVQTLEVMCDKDNPQDKKILLLAELVEHKCDALGENQRKLQESLNSTSTKLDRITELLERYEGDTHECPVYMNRKEYERLSFYVRNPKIALLIAIGAVVVFGGFFGTALTDLFKSVLGL